MDFNGEVFAMKKLAAIALALLTCLGSIGPASAYDVRYPRGKAVDSITGARNAPIGATSNPCSRYNNCDRGRHRNSDRARYRHDDRRYYNDRRHYDDRRYYRRHSDNTGAIIGGLAAGAIIGGAIASQSGARYGDSHVDYCYNRYRSYRASDNTYQPNSGPRRQCVGP